jgi:hypothetical protein
MFDAIDVGQRRGDEITSHGSAHVERAGAPLQARPLVVLGSYAVGAALSRA